MNLYHLLNLNSLKQTMKCSSNQNQCDHQQIVNDMGLTGNRKLLNIYKMIRGLEYMTCEERARKLDLFSLENASGDPLAAFQYLQGCHQEDLAKLSTVVRGWRTRHNRHKLKREIQAGYKENLLPHVTVKQWIRLPKEFVESPTLEVFKTGLNKTLENLV